MTKTKAKAVRIGEPIRQFIPVSVGFQGKIAENDYVIARRVANNPSLRLTVVERAQADFEAWLHRYESYAEFLGVFSPILEAYQTVKKSLQGAKNGED